MTVANEELTSLVEPIVVGSGFDLEDVSVDTGGARGRITVTVDRDGGSELDDLAALSRKVAGVLDSDSRWSQETYVLEVTSPGIDRPLTVPRHWRRAQGRPVTVSLRGSEKSERLTARVGALGADESTVDLVIRRGGATSVRTVALAEIVSAVAGVDFSAPAVEELRLAGLSAAEIAARTSDTTSDPKGHDK